MEKKKEASPSLKKWKALWTEERPLKARAIPAVLCAFAFTFTFIMFGPCEIYVGNINDMPFSFFDLAPMLVLAGALTFLALTGVLLLLRGKIFDYGLSFLLAVTVAGYIQGNFLNIDHGTLDGKEITWLYYKWPMMGNLTFWLLVVLGAFALLYFNRTIWSQATRFVPSLLILMQMAALAAVLMNPAIRQMPEQRGDGHLSRDGIYELAPQKNVVFFLLDRCDSSYMDTMLEQHPEWVEQLNGFTSYHDFTGSFSRTYPSIAYLLNGVYKEGAEPFVVPVRDYLRQAWSEGTLLPEIHQAGNWVGLYSDFNNVVAEIQNVADTADNISQNHVLVHKGVMLKKMLDLSAYRYLPETMKPYFRIYTGDMQQAVYTADQNLYQVDDYIFWTNYQESGLTVNQALNGTFQFYHLKGAHLPTNMNENVELVETGTAEGNMTGNWKMILKYLEELKAKGLYEETTIIISTDHAADYPSWPTVTSELDSPRMLPLLIKPANADLSQPMQISNKQVCQDNLRASIAGYFGLDTQKYGRTIESVGENEPMTRTFWMQLYDETLQVRDAYTGVYEITGDGNDFSNWHLKKKVPLSYPN